METSAPGGELLPQQATLEEPLKYGARVWDGLGFGGLGLRVWDLRFGFGV